MEKINVKFYHDAAHGWYQVKRKDLMELNILEKITSFSYQDDDFVYLEEDQDASTFFRAVKEQNIEIIEAEDVYQEKSSVRRLERFKI